LGVPFAARAKGGAGHQPQRGVQHRQRVPVPDRVEPQRWSTAWPGLAWPGLANAADPVEAGRGTEPTAACHHDTQIVTYTSDPYAGRETEFGLSEGRGVDIVDVTDKSNSEYCRESDDACVAYGDGDFDFDGDRDLLDFARVQECFGSEAGPACAPGNLTGDAVIDLEDQTAFEQVLGGPL